ncbi:MAG: endonuclease [Balneola sp.]|jgi:endonuclease I
MNRFLLTFCAVLFFVSNSAAQNDTIGSGLSETALIEFLRTNYTPSTPKDYDEARDSMYQHLDVDETDSLTGVYSGLRAKADGSRTPSNGSLSFNTEHSWPQGYYDHSEPMRGDIHQLYPVWSSVNSSRNNHPFGEVDDNSTTSWWYWKNGESEPDIPSVDIDLYSEYGNSTFEPREDHKGNAARAMFYFWTIYQNNSDVANDPFDNEAFFNGMKETLYQWHQDDPVDAAELQRSEGIESIQGNKNPFIHDTTLVRRAYFYEEPSTSTLPEVYISEVYEANGGTVKYVELFNTTDSDINFTTDDWALIRYSNANGTGSGSTISLTGTIKAKDFYVIGDDNASSGVQSIFGEGVIDQNESGINHNGNDKYTLVKDASVTPEQIDAFAGDNIGNDSTFASNQVAYRIYSELPNDGDFNQGTPSSSGETVASGDWKVFDISSSNANAKLVATPGYSKGIESSKLTENMITGSAGWRLISIPSNTPTLSQISDDVRINGVDNGEDPNIFTYSNSGSYSTPSTLNTALNKGEALAVYFFDNNVSGSTELPIVLDLESDQTDPSTDVSVSLNTSTELSSSYFTLVGNPFQSNFDMNTATVDASIQGNIHLLENGLYYAVDRTSSIVLPWQGFWVESPNSNVSSSITFPTSGKTSSGATQSAYSKQFALKNELQFKLRSNKTFDQGCRISFLKDAVDGRDRFDASKLTPTVSEYAILSCSEDGVGKSVHSLPELEQTEVRISLHIDSYNVEDDLELEWEISEALLNNATVVLRDVEKNIEKVLSGSGNYSFEHASISTKSSKNITSSLESIPVKMKEGSSERFVLIVSPSTFVSNDDEKLEITEFDLEQNYPNPFNPSTSIRYSLSKPSNVSLKIYSSTGQEVATLVQSYQSKGAKTVEWNASHMASGIYYVQLRTKGLLKTIKMTLVK